MFECVSVSVLSSIFATLLFVGFIAVLRMLIGQEILYYKLSKTVPLAIILPTFIEKQIFKGKNKNPKRL